MFTVELKASHTKHNNYENSEASERIISGGDQGQANQPAKSSSSRRNSHPAGGIAMRHESLVCKV